MKFELHCHSIHSHGRKIKWEGTASPSIIAKSLKEKGIQGFALTDHDSIAGWKESREAAKKLHLVFIPSMEISTLSGHLIALGINEKVQSRLSLEESIDRVHEQGGITVAPHPLDAREEGIRRDFRKADAVEVFNSLVITRVENAVMKAKARRMGLCAVGGSDAHTPEMLGMTTNTMDARDVDSALRMIKKGKVKVEGRYVPVPVIVRWARERMRMSYDEIISYVDKNYSRPKASFLKFMLRLFVNNETSAWNALGYFSVGVSTIYAMLKLALV